MKEPMSAESAVHFLHHFVSSRRGIDSCKLFVRIED